LAFYGHNLHEIHKKRANKRINMYFTALSDDFGQNVVLPEKSILMPVSVIFG